MYLTYIHTYIHTHIHNWRLQPINQDYGLAPHTIHIVCINFIHVWRDLQFNVDSERQIIYDRFLLSEFLPEIC